MEKKTDIIYGVPVFGKWHHHWLWLPTLYLMRGIPYVILFLTSIVFFSQLRLDSSFITLSTSWFILPFIVRPFTSRLVLSFESKRFWILMSEFLIGLSLIGVAMAIPLKDWFRWSYAFFCLIGWAASLHDVAIERFYKRSAHRKRKSAFIGMRLFFYAMAVLVAFALPVIMVGNLEVLSRLIKTPWIKTFYGLGAFSLLLMIYHAFVLPPAYVQSSLPFFTGLTRSWLKDVVQHYTKHPDNLRQLLFLLLFPLPSEMFFRTLTLFLFDAPSGGGLAFSPQEVAFMQGVAGLLAFMIGLIVGNHLVKRMGVAKLKWVFLLAIILPKLLFVYLSYSFSNSQTLVMLCVMTDCFGFGFALNLYALLLLNLASGKHPTFSYTLGASVMGLSVLLSSFLIGFVQEYFNYQNVFIFIFFSGAVSILSMRFVHLDAALDEKLRKFADKRKMHLL